MLRYLLADVGSTFTKLTAVDEEGRILAQASSATTIATNVMEGFSLAQAEIIRQSGCNDFTLLACSSAAGGLAMVASGLVPELTGQAAKLAVLGAGAKVLDVLGFRLNPDELARLATADMLMLAGGTDGGNRHILLENAELLAKSCPPLPVVLAGNKECVHQAAAILREAGFAVKITANVMPQLGKLNIEPAREAIRELFLSHIVAAKGMGQLNSMLASPIMPTPAAVLAGGRLAAQDYPELLIIDIGGATTDIYSFGANITPPGVMRRGFTPPREMRTVEADIGMRYSLETLVEQAGIEELLAGSPHREAWQQELTLLLNEPERLVPPELANLETALARAGVRLAVARHGGSLEQVWTPAGAVNVLSGKDLSGIRTIIGVGGALVNSQIPREILAGALGPHPEKLLPAAPEFMLDSKYIMAAAGLLAEVAPAAARGLLKESLCTV
jgi:uncharacterized protein (TIGR01319 family)